MKAMKRVSPPSIQPVVAVDSRAPVLRPSSKIVRYSCLYTKQMNKKRKVWSDGVLKVLIDGDCLYHCTLVDLEDVRELGLDSRQLEPAEIARFREKKPHLLELESHIVDLSFDEINGGNDKDAITAAALLPSAPLKLPKFVPPSRCVRPAQTQTTTSSGGRALPQTQTQTLAHTQQIAPSKPPSASFGGKNYTLNEDELDDIWGTAKPSTSADSRSSHVNDMNVSSATQDAPRRGETGPGWDDGETFIEPRRGLSRSTLDNSSSSSWTSSSGVSKPDNRRNVQNLNRGGFNQTHTSSSVLREKPQNALGLNSFLTSRERDDERSPQNDLNNTSLHQDNEEEWDFQHAWMPSVDQSNAANIRSAVHVDESIWD